MTATTHPSSPQPMSSAERLITLALRLAHAENALHALTSGQVDAIIDPDGQAYLLRPAQDHLRANERRMQTVIESVADVLMVVDRGGVILSQSRAVRRVLGYEPEELVGSSIFALIHEEDWPRFYAAFFNVIEEFRTEALVEFRHRTRDGTYRLIEATVGKFRDLSSPSVVFSLRPRSRPLQERQKPAWSNAFDMSPAGEERESIILSHGRRIPLTRAPLGTDFSAPPPE